MKGNSFFNNLLYKKNIIIFIALIAIYSFYKIGNKYLSIEELAISPGIGCDIVRDGSNFKYKVSTSVYNIQNENNIFSEVIISEGKTIPQTREKRQPQLNHKFAFGLEKVILCGENYATMGIKNLVDSLFHNKDVNDVALLLVCSGNAEDIIKFNVPGYPSSSDYIKDIAKRADEYNFSYENYKFIDAYVRMGSEGRNFVTPFITIKDNKVQMDGTAIFNKDKMIKKISNDETKILNLLRENGGRGMLTLQDSPYSYISIYGVSKHKSSCEKTDTGYRFKIKVFLTGEITSNTYNSNLAIEENKISDLEKAFENELKKDCEDFINKMQQDYKIDCLELGRVAASKYGKHLGTDWNKVVINSKIDVETTVKIEHTERGDY